MFRTSKHKKHQLRTKFLAKQRRVIIPPPTEPSLSITDTSLTASEASQNLSITSDPQLTETAEPSLPFFEESVLFEYKTKQYSKCIKTIERILKVTPKDQSSHYKILLAAANTMIGKKFKRSHNLLNEVLAKNPFDAYALYGKGVAYYFEGKFDESIRYFDRAIDVTDNGMEQAKEMKILAQLENKQVKVLLEKIKFEVGEKSDEEVDENCEKSLSFVHAEDDSENEGLEGKQDDSLATLQKTPKSSTEKSENLAENGSTSKNSLDKPKSSTSQRSLRSANGSSNSQTSPKPLDPQTPPKTPQDSLIHKFSSESFKEVTTKSARTFESSSEDDSAELRPTTSANSFAQVKFNKALDLYMIGQLERSLKYFQKSLKYEPDFEEADEMETKAQEFIELLEIIDINMTEKNYAAVVEICTDGLEIDEGNDAVNRKILFYRGLSYFHLGENEKSLKDYEEYERLERKLEIIEDAK